MGVPIAGCTCRVCISSNPRDKRLRTSAYINVNNTQILIDTSADYRQQMLRADIRHLDAVIYTHHHVDHILGMDDLRSFNILNRVEIPLYGREETMHNLQRVFSYAFNNGESESTIPKLRIHHIDASPFRIKDTEVVPIPIMHGKLPIFGYRIGDFAYCTDVSHIPESSFERLKGVKVLILGALRHKPHPTHFNIEQATEAAQKIGADETYFTHIAHSVLHDETEAALPDRIHLSYDGLSFDL